MSAITCVLPHDGETHDRGVRRIAHRFPVFDSSQSGTGRGDPSGIKRADISAAWMSGGLDALGWYPSRKTGRERGMGWARIMIRPATALMRSARWPPYETHPRP